MVEQVHPFERGELNGLEGALWSTAVNDLGLAGSVDALGQGVVSAIAGAAYEGSMPAWAKRAV
jgi:hypothetical protein